MKRVYLYSYTMSTEIYSQNFRDLHLVSTPLVTKNYIFWCKGYFLNKCYIVRFY